METLESPPLTGLRVVELAGLAPAPFASLLLTSFGALTLRIDRPPPTGPASRPAPPAADLLAAHKSSIALDLKSPASRSLLLALLARADVLIDPYRPGVLESLGLAPARLRAANSRLVIARLTGFRRDGKYARMAGHDVNYLAVSGALAQLGRRGQPPAFPANLLADFAGGGLMCAFGILLALLQRERTERGQVVEANMVDGVSALGSIMRFARKTPLWDRPRGENLLDGGCPWYEVYETKDGEYMAVGALEPQFFRELIRWLGLDDELNKGRMDRRRWPEIKESFEERFKSKTRKEWEEVFDGKDACVTPVLSMNELEESGYEQRPAVGLSASPARKPEGSGWERHVLAVGEGGEKLLKDWMGWKRGIHFDVVDGALTKKDGAKL